MTSSHFDGWNLDKYRTDYESEEHWNLKRRFMEVHKDKFSENRLVCLAQVFINIECMGCKYPSETMRLVEELSQEVAKEFRKSRANRLKRTFVKASDAAEARVKGRKIKISKEPEKFLLSAQSEESIESKIRTPGIGVIDLFDGLPFGKLVLRLVGGRNCLRTSAHRSNMEFLEKEVVVTPGEKKGIDIIIDDKLVVSVVDETIKATKAKAFAKSLEILQQLCYSIKLNPARDKVKIDKSDDKVVCGVMNEQAECDTEKRLDATNKGFKMMKMMGWGGGGLGSKTQGREEPVSYLLKNNRCGLGIDASRNLDRSYFSQMLNNYLKSDDIRELQFEATFTKDERAILHELAGKFNLKSTSRGKGDARNLVISKKNITDEEILTKVLIEKNPSYCDKYLVQVPVMKSQYFPDNTQHIELDLDS